MISQFVGGGSGEARGGGGVELVRSGRRASQISEEVAQEIRTREEVAQEIRTREEVAQEIRRRIFRGGEKLAQQYIQELLLQVEQIDGKDSRELVKKDFMDCGKDYSKIKVLVRQLTTNYAPEHMDRWEDIVRKIDEANQVTLFSSCNYH
jgi:hypothetical protein